jgi:multiple sugar transport system permease protein
MSIQSGSAEAVAPIDARREMGMLERFYAWICSERGFIAFCILPIVSFLAVVTVAPSIVAMIDSLRELSLIIIGKRGEFVGLDHYRNLLGDDQKFFTAIAQTGIFVIVVVPIQFVLGLAIALWLEKITYGRRILLTLIMIPTMTAPVVVGMIWRFLLMPSIGVITSYLNQFGFFVETTIFSEGFSAFVALMVIDTWEWTPFIVLILLAGLTGMPQSPMEAAALDGASAWRIIWHVKIPLLRPLIVVALLLRTIEATKVFDIVYVLTGGGPGNATEMISTFAFRTNFISWNLGYGAAICLVLVFMSLIVAAAFYKLVTIQEKKNAHSGGDQ